MEIKIKDKNGITLTTKDKICEEDIKITFDKRLLEQDYTNEDGLIDRTLTSYSNNRITKIGVHAFRGFSTLTSLKVPVATRIEAYGVADCVGLQEVDFTNVEYIGQQGLASLKCNLVLPNIKTIYVQAFLSASFSALVITNTEQIATLSNVSAFQNSSIAKGTGFVYTPDELLDQYKNSTNWSTYATQIKGLSELPQEIREELGL